MVLLEWALYLHDHLDDLLEPLQEGTWTADQVRESAAGAGSELFDAVVLQKRTLWVASTTQKVSSLLAAKIRTSNPFWEAVAKGN